MANNLFPDDDIITNEGKKVRKGSMIFGVLVFILLVTGIVLCIVFGKLYLILAVLAFIVVVEAIWIVIFNGKMQSISELEKKKNYIIIKKVSGKTKNIKKAEMQGVKRKGKKYIITLKDGNKLKTVKSPVFKPEGAKKFFSKADFPGCEIDV